jgi:hypothetical protein
MLDKERFCTNKLWRLNFLAPTFWNWRQNLITGDFSGANIFGARAAPENFLGSLISTRLGQKKIYVYLRSPDPPYFSAADPNLFYRQLFNTNFCKRPYQFLHRIRITIFVV